MSTATGSNPPAGGSSGSHESTSNPPAGGSGSQGNNSISDPQANPQYPPAGEEPISLDVARELRRTNKSQSEQIKELTAKLTAFEQAQLTAQEKIEKNYSALQDKYAALEEVHQRLRLTTSVKEAAKALGIIDDEAAYALLITGGELETDDEGNYKNLTKLLEKLVADKPWLLSSNQPRSVISPTSGGATNPGRSTAPAAQQPARPDGKSLYQQHRTSGGLGNPNLWKRNP